MSTGRTGDEIGAAFATALAVRDTEALLALFRPDIDFRGMTPGRFWEADSPQAVIHDVLYSWFEPHDLVDSVEQASTELVIDRWRVDYRFKVRCPDGLYRVEQRAYFDLDDQGRISKMNAICSGFRKLEDD